MLPILFQPKTKQYRIAFGRQSKSAGLQPERQANMQEIEGFFSFLRFSPTHKAHMCDAESRAGV